MSGKHCGADEGESQVDAEEEDGHEAEKAVDGGSFGEDNFLGLDSMLGHNINLSNRFLKYF